MIITRHLTPLVFLLTMTRAADSQQPPRPPRPPRPTTLAHRSTVYAPHGMIATSQPLATAAGLAVLQRGGNAIDAAVTAAAVLNVVEPPMTGIGGDMFALVWSANDHKLYGLNASGRSGSLMTRDALLAKGHATMPGESVEDVTVPGALSGWDDLRDHRPEWVEPVAADFQGHRVWELPPNGQGVAALEMLRILEPYDLKALGHNSAPYLHLLIEAKKLAFADIARYVGEPSEMTLPASALLSDRYVASRRALIDPRRAADRP